MTTDPSPDTTPDLGGGHNPGPGGASCGVGSPYPAPAPVGGGGTRAAADPGGPDAARDDGPGVPSFQGEDKPSAAEPPAAPAYRRRLRQRTQRQHRVSPRFSDDEWTLLQTVASASGFSVGGYTAAAALSAASSSDPNAAVADYRRGIQELMESNRQLGGVGNNLNQLSHYLNAGGKPATDVQRLLARIDTAIGEVDQAVAWLVNR